MSRKEQMNSLAIGNWHLSAQGADSRALLLLTLYLGPEEKTQPLWPEEYNRLAAWLLGQGLRPGDLLSRTIDTIALCPVPQERLARLLAREDVLTQKLEQWLALGIVPKPRTEADYPPRLKLVLKKYAPPVLFWLGSPALLAAPSVSLVGSREIASDGEAFARETGRLAAMQGLALVSGGAKGADHAALDACLAAGGRALVYAPQGIARFPVPRSWREAVHEQRLTLVAPVLPYAPWSVTNAVARNRLIYAHSPVTLIAASEAGTGGTWGGATEALSRKLTRVVVRNSADAPEGNRALIALGAEGVGDEGIVEVMK